MKSLVCGLVICAVMPAAVAQTGQSDPNAVTMTVMPMVLDVKAPKVSDTITVRNGSRKPMQVQFRIFRWQKRDGKNYFAPTTDAVVTPPFLKISPGADGEVRVVRTAKAPVSGEESYRVFVDQMPSSRVRVDVSGSQPGVSMILSQSVPVFFSSGQGNSGPSGGGQAAADPSQAAAPDLMLTQTSTNVLAFSVQSNGGRYNLTVANSGARRIRLVDVELLAGGTRIARKKGLLGYALPGQSANFSLSGRGGGLPDRVRYTTEAGRFEMPL